MGHENNQPHYLKESDAVGHGDGGACVPLVWPEVFRETPALRVLHGLQDIGVPITDERETLAQIQSDIDSPGGNEIFAALRIYTDWLITAKRSAKEVGETVHTAAYLLRTPHAAKNLAQLGVMIGKGKTQAHNIAKKVNALLRDFAQKFNQTSPAD